MQNIAAVGEQRSRKQRITLRDSGIVQPGTAAAAAWENIAPKVATFAAAGGEGGAHGAGGVDSQAHARAAGYRRNPYPRSCECGNHGLTTVPDPTSSVR